MTRSAVLPIALALVTALSLGACKRSETAAPGGTTSSTTTGSTSSSMGASAPASAASQ